ncbi:glycosyltransferase [Nitratireductor basaltis]|uniref:glycosyltransferase n=1 Tax=Nitratireductor basaltis TaxID=472175 RepID=UPI001FCAE58A|nr:glycosyltransferase [Nitratireductor basaltis]
MAQASAVIVIPACNEAERIGDCLDALAAQVDAAATAIHVCVNNSNDDTVAIVRDRARQHRLPLALSEACFCSGGVGRARRLGHRLALRHSPRAQALLSTDADCQAEANWSRQMRAALQSHPAVLGRIEGLNDLPDDLLHKVWRGGELEDRYLRLSMELAQLLHDVSDTFGLNNAGGANLGIRRDVYLGIGGFRAFESREDRDLIDRVISAGYRPARADEAVVRASMRPDGRAPGGMADKIAARLAGTDLVLDSALAPLEAMLSKFGRGNCVAPQELTAEQAAIDLPVLASHVARLKGMTGPEARRQYLATASGRVSECV